MAAGTLPFGLIFTITLLALYALIQSFLLSIHTLISELIFLMEQTIVYSLHNQNYVNKFIFTNKKQIPILSVSI